MSRADSKERSPTVIVVGGGPAGATTASILAQHGVPVLLLDRAKMPRFHIGESLITETYWTFERLGMLDKLKASDFPRKHSVQFISETGKPSKPFYFADRDPHESSVTWQVDRAEFDAMMLENARELGVEVRTEWEVKKFVVEEDRVVGVEGTTRDGERFTDVGEYGFEAADQGIEWSL